MSDFSNSDSGRSDPQLSDAKAMAFGDHLEELRKRLIWAMVSVLPIFIVSLAFGDTLLEWLTEPARRKLVEAGQPGQLLQTNPIELLSAWLKVSFVVTIAVGIPLILYQAWLFIAPGLYDHEKRFARILLPLSVALSTLALLFLYFVMLPAMLSFLIHFGTSLGKQTAAVAPPPAGITFPVAPMLDADPPSPKTGEFWINVPLKQIHINVGTDAAPDVRAVQLVLPGGVSQQYKVSEYVELLFTTSLAFIAAFQTPVVVLLLGWSGIVSRQSMASKRKYVLFFAAAAAAVLAPSPDPFSMIALTIPLYGLYEFGLVLLTVLPASRVIKGFGTKPTREPSDAGDD